MKTKSLYHGRRAPAFVISCAARGYFRFLLSLRKIAGLLFVCGVVVSYGTIPCWDNNLRASFTRCARTARR
jgi:hypothetical protein